MANKTYPNGYIRTIQKEKALRYIARFGGSIDDLGVTPAGADAYCAVWQMRVLRDHTGLLLAQVMED